MTVKITQNFFKNARGLTFKDANGLTWSINSNTNEITLSGAGVGTVTSVGLSDASGTAIYTVGSSPVTTSGTISLTLKTQIANLVFAGPGSGGAAQPTFRAMVAADFQTLSPVWTGANTFGAGLTTFSGTVSATNGTATTLKALASLPWATYLVTVQIASIADATNFSAVSIVSTNVGVARSVSLQTAGFMTLSVSGLNVQATQTSGATQTISYSIVRISI